MSRTSAHPEPEQRRRCVAPRVLVRSRCLRERARLHDLSDRLTDGVSGRGIADQAERFGRAALHEERVIAEGRDERIARALVPDETERKRGHLSHLGIEIAEKADERLNAFPQPHPSNGERRASTHARVLVGQEPHQIRRRQWQGDDGRSLAPLRDW